MKINGIKETCLYINDPKKTGKFYSEVLGLEIHSETEDYVFFKAGKDMLLCFRHGTTDNQTSLPPHYATGQIHFAFEVSRQDYEKWKEKIKTAGIEIEFEKQWTEESSSFYFRDPDMHCLEILSPGLWD